MSILKFEQQVHRENFRFRTYYTHFLLCAYSVAYIVWRVPSLLFDVFRIKELTRLLNFNRLFYIV